MNLYKIQNCNPLYWIERIVPKIVCSADIILEDWHNNSYFEFEMEIYFRGIIDDKKISQSNRRIAFINYMLFIVLSNFSVTIKFSSCTIKITDNILCLKGYDKTTLDDLEYDFDPNQLVKIS